MRILARICLALRITFLEVRIELRRYEMARLAAKLDADRRAVNLAHQAFGGTDRRRYRPSVHQLRSR